MIWTGKLDLALDIFVYMFAGPKNFVAVMTFFVLFACLIGSLYG